ncbi:hypothetical protein Tdes44962_MAKER02580 [Teratosphaeria destructans]|uniref:Uncharacterized protein n=1 Tax=Teratosphaeria destructans TaxID=418781 RepID=A0A9W7ST36_9PEZI|nr:hypothetical protein Tdes44962_MAKER02580 [Teratosphaeria destructans]
MAGDHSSFSFDTVAVLVAVLNQKGVSIGMKEFKMMSALDGERGASSFDHQFRAVKKRANELKAQLGDGAQASPAKATPRKGGKKAAGGEEETPASKKRGQSLCGWFGWGV